MYKRFIEAYDGFDWDHRNLAKCQQHGVSFREIESLFGSEFCVLPDIAHSTLEQRFMAIGKTNAGRSVFIVFTLRRLNADMMVRPISARYMHEKEVASYETAIAKTNQR